LALEAQLCRNMHQMLAIEKQKSKLKKTTREIKKYLQRCKSWLSDKKAFCEMHTMTIQATNKSMKSMYEDLIRRQMQTIAKMKALDEFKNVDLSDFDSTHYDQLPQHSGPAATLCALRGLPFVDSVRLLQEAEQKAAQEGTDEQHHPSGTLDEDGKQRPELYITAKDDVSVHSNLSDPDEPDDPGFDSSFVKEGAHASVSSSGFDFGKDAPWNKSDSHVDSSDSGSMEEAFAHPFKPPANNKDLSTIGEARSTDDRSAGAGEGAAAAAPPSSHASDEENTPNSRSNSSMNGPVKQGKSGTEESTSATEPTGENTRVLRAL
jgi:hypothetical protein